jgi:hypothetical protein
MPLRPKGINPPESPFRKGGQKGIIEEAKIALKRLRDPRDKRISKDEIRAILGL